MDDDSLNLILLYTNNYIQSIQQRYSRIRDAQSTNMIELKAFLGVLYLTGINRNNRTKFEDMRTTDCTVK